MSSINWSAFNRAVLSVTSLSLKVVDLGTTVLSRALRSSHSYLDKQLVKYSESAKKIGSDELTEWQADEEDQNYYHALDPKEQEFLNAVLADNLPPGPIPTSLQKSEVSSPADTDVLDEEPQLSRSSVKPRLVKQGESSESG